MTRSVLVTGASNGIGRGIVARLAADGFFPIKEEPRGYAASKAGLIGLTKTWALELARDGITVNAIGPGPIATELFHAANPPESPRTRALVDGVPVGRLGTPADIAHAAAFFMRDAAPFVTGQVLYVCGAMTVGRAA